MELQTNKTKTQLLLLDFGQKSVSLKVFLTVPVTVVSDTHSPNQLSSRERSSELYKRGGVDIYFPAVEEF